MIEGPDVVVVGAGLAGLTAARTLQARGQRVVVVDKGRRPGGRCATRELAGATLDTGAQFFTARSGAFRDLVAGWQAEGVPIRAWADGFARARDVRDGPAAAETAADGHPRYSVTGGMNRLAAHLAGDVDVRVRCLATEIRPEGAGWAVRLADGEELHARAAVVTAPAPQALALLDAGGVPGSWTVLRARTYEPCVALLLALDRAPALPGPGGVQVLGGPVTWLADGVAKGASAVPAVTVHAGPAWSETWYPVADDAVTAELLRLVGPWLGPARPVATEVFRWRYSKPHAATDEGALSLPGQHAPLVLAGDAYAGAKVEGAVTSGLAAADLV